MSDGNISQDDIDNILASLTGDENSLDMPTETEDNFESTTPAVSSSSGGGGASQAPKDSVDTENIPLLLDVNMKLSVILGSTRRPIRDVLDMGTGSVIEMDRFVGEDVDVFVNDQVIGKGQIVAIDDEYGIKITRILHPIKKMGFKK